MRTHDATHRTLLRGSYALFTKLEVANASGSFIDYSAWLDYEAGCTVSATIDNPVQSATISLIRESQSSSLAPFLSSSLLNRDNGGFYAPALDPSRQVKLSIAPVPIGTTPSAGDWRVLFWGYIDKVSWGDTPIKLTCRDLGKHILDTFIEHVRAYGATLPPGSPMETVITQILVDNISPAPALVLPSGSPGFDFGPFSQAQVNTFEAIRVLAARSGWDIRYKWNGSAFSLSLYPVDRLKTVVDTTFGPSEYLDVTGLDMDDANIRNVVEGFFADSLAGGAVTPVLLTDPVSIARYNIRRYMSLGEDPLNGINTAVEMNTFLQSILSDVANPKAEQIIETLLFWPVELGDLYGFLANGVHYDSQQDLAVVGWTHTLKGDLSTTTMVVRGRPAGAYDWWFTHGADPGLPDADLTPEIRWINAPEPIYSGTEITGWRVSGAVDEDTHAVVLLISGGMTLDTAFPNYTASSLAGFTEYWIDLTGVPETVKQFTAILSQVGGEVGSVTIEPRELFNPLDVLPRAGLVGEAFTQILSRAPVTVVTITRVTTTLFSLLLSVSPVSSTMMYRFDAVTSADPWTSAKSVDGTVVIGRGTSAEPYIDVSTGKRSLEYRSISDSGVAEDVHRLVLDQEDTPFISLKVIEAVPHVLTVSWTINDNVSRVVILARKEGDPRLTDMAPDGAYVKYDGTGQASSVHFQADS